MVMRGVEKGCIINANSLSLWGELVSEMWWRRREVLIYGGEDEGDGKGI